MTNEQNQELISLLKIIFPNFNLSNKTIELNAFYFNEKSLDSYLIRFNENQKIEKIVIEKNQLLLLKD